MADLKEWELKRNKEEKIVKRLSVEVKSLTKELKRVTFKELKQEDFKPSVELEDCCTRDDMFEDIFSKLVTLTGDLKTCVDNTQLLEDVRDLTTCVQSQYNYLDERIKRLEKNEAQLREEDQEKLKALKKDCAVQHIQMEQMETMYATIFRQHCKQVTNSKGSLLFSSYRIRIPLRTDPPAMIGLYTHVYTHA